MSETFLSRWARRKDAVRTAEQTETPPAPPDVAATEAAFERTEPDAPRALEARTDPVSDPAPVELPSLDALTADTDLTAFLRANVPAALRKAALRRMWSLDPSIRDFVSEAREYAYDWNIPGGVPGTGPLLASDDVPAMLRRLIAGVPPKTDPADAEGGNEEPIHPSPELDAETVATEPQAAAITLADAEPATVTEPRTDTVEAVSQAPPTAPRNSPAPSRLRRHGGAMPT